ncbi:hypothetical protein N7520_000424 [Penicillium odoratum]|uniref:uncharacterized protein n=1 Tax=Penicillium odoratum TaxID=1167516 RepID=UPI0025498D3B|nr:uncharacterized protein N7520_000424 [Penicillium odoratum]KAJ5777178.1 hypothetical protein N7520_000424 [Penicillium odoratum]
MSKVHKRLVDAELYEKNAEGEDGSVEKEMAEVVPVDSEVFGGEHTHAIDGWVCATLHPAMVWVTGPPGTPVY